MVEFRERYGERRLPVLNTHLKTKNCQADLNRRLLNRKKQLSYETF